MNAFFQYLNLAISALIFCSCSNTTGQKEIPKIPLPVNKDSIVKSASGQYSGMIPCADCEGINYTVNLQPTMNFSSKYIYVGKNVPPLEITGNWSMIGDSIIFLQSNTDVPSFMRIYFNDSLVMLDESKNRMTGPVSSMFVLRRENKNTGDTVTAINISIPSVNFVLEELNGKKIRNGDFKTTPEILIEANKSTVAGNTGCNSFNGNVKVTKHKIYFTNIAMTRMSCPGDGEKNFVEALNGTNNFKMENGKLILMKFDTPVAVFTQK